MYFSQQRHCGFFFIKLRNKNDSTLTDLFFIYFFIEPLQNINITARLLILRIICAKSIQLNTKSTLN